MVSLKCPMAKRARSNIPQFRVRVPDEVANQLRGKRLLLSLGNPNDGPCIKSVTTESDVAFSLETENRTNRRGAAGERAGSLEATVRTERG